MHPRREWRVPQRLCLRQRDDRRLRRDLPAQLHDEPLARLRCLPLRRGRNLPELHDRRHLFDRQHLRHAVGGHLAAMHLHRVDGVWHEPPLLRGHCHRRGSLRVHLERGMPRRQHLRHDHRSVHVMWTPAPPAARAIAFAHPSNEPCTRGDRGSMMRGNANRSTAGLPPAFRCNRKRVPPEG